jgi:hypothetical protein
LNRYAPRRLILALAAVAVLASTPAIGVAGVCQDTDGAPIRCHARGAMPEGWTISPQQLMDRQTFGPKEPSATQLFGVFCFIGGFFALVLLMPKFDSWDRQEEDEEEHG